MAYDDQEDPDISKNPLKTKDVVCTEFSSLPLITWQVMLMLVASVLLNKESRHYKGVRLASGQDLFSHELVMNPSFTVRLPTLLSPSSNLQHEYALVSSLEDIEGKVARAVCIIRGPIKPDLSNLLVVTSARALQFGSNMAVCPSGLTQYHPVSAKPVVSHKNNHLPCQKISVGEPLGFDREVPPGETPKLHKISTCQKIRPSIAEETREPPDAKLASPAGVPTDDANDSRCALTLVSSHVPCDNAWFRPSSPAPLPISSPSGLLPSTKASAAISDIPGALFLVWNSYKHPWSSPMGFDNTLLHSQIRRPRLSSSIEKTTPYQSSQSRSSTLDSEPLKTSAPLLPDQLQAPADALFSLWEISDAVMPISPSLEDLPRPG
ncbi:hypothetical protein NE237_000048 [Protea cynaroides]|uniref:Uncharacterized protein n=1 Tax=Protea cynaroides TaxID=273540 RepID=A0A9Q0GMM4_9MAGN|nr:hypothetical protein NE237_000048 [Protea cynaroides]